MGIWPQCSHKKEEEKHVWCMEPGGWCLFEAPHPQPHIHNCVALSDCQRNVEEAAF